MKLLNKSILITGGSLGLGKEIAKNCLIEGASVAICARNTKILKEAYNELQRYKQQNQLFIYKETDISNKEETKAFVEYCLDHFKKIDVLINNAGIHGSKNTIDDVDFDLENWINALSVNLMGTLNMCLAVVPYLKQNGHGKIINLSGGGRHLLCRV